MSVGPGGRGGDEDRRLTPSARAGSRPRQGPHRRRQRSPLRQLRGSGRVIPFRRQRPAGPADGLAPRQSRLLVVALATVLAGVLVLTTAVLRPRSAPPGRDIVLAASQFALDQPRYVAFADYPHVAPAAGRGMFVVRTATGWAAFADRPPDQPPTAAAGACTLVWSVQAARFQDPCTGAAWLMNGTPAAAAGSRVPGLTAFAVTETGAFIDVNVGRVGP
jgi:hypothetical protein